MRSYIFRVSFPYLAAVAVFHIRPVDLVPRQLRKPYRNRFQAAAACGGGLSFTLNQVDGKKLPFPSRQRTMQRCKSYAEKEEPRRVCLLYYFPLCASRKPWRRPSWKTAAAEVLHTNGNGVATTGVMCVLTRGESNEPPGGRNGRVWGPRDAVKDARWGLDFDRLSACAPFRCN